MHTSLAIYAPLASFETVKNPFGKDTANLGLFQALAEHGGFSDLHFLLPNPSSDVALRNALLKGRTSSTRLHASSVHDRRPATQAGSLLRGKADLADLAWVRRATGDRSYSLIGLVHTIAPPAIREQIAAATLAPVQPWDALICTSPAVRDSLTVMFDAWGDYLGNRFQGRERPRPQLPLIPLGVDASALATKADRIDQRVALRDRLGLEPEDILILWLGRLSFFEKAFPQPMFRAIEEARALSGKRLCFAMGGWFPNGEVGRSLYEEAARAYAPSVPLFILDGNDQSEIERMWAAADIFLSLVDNIQETFGLTPLEAMAAGLPIVASDWDGYRFTMADAKEAFLIKTLCAPPSDTGRLISARHVLGVESYQAYVGTVAQHTAVDVGEAAVALARLAQDPDLRQRMGRAGQERVRKQFDWPVVASQVRGLVEDLERERLTSTGYGTESSWISNPVKGEPFADFAGFATGVLSSSTRVGLRSGTTEQQAQAELQRCSDVRLDKFADQWRINPADCRAFLNYLATNGAQTVAQVQSLVPPASRDSLALTIVWMCKLGILEWN